MGVDYEQEYDEDDLECCFGLYGVGCSSYNLGDAANSDQLQELEDLEDGRDDAFGTNGFSDVGEREGRQEIDHE